MIVAFISDGVMAYVLVTYGLRDDSPPPTSKTTEQAHAGAQHFTAEKPEHEGGKPSPIQVWENAKVGEWRAYKVITETTLAATITATAMTRIREVQDKQVIRSFNGRIDATGEVRNDRDEERPRQGLTIDQLTGNDVGGWTIYELFSITNDDIARSVAARSSARS